MAADFKYQEDNGATPGASRGDASQVNWKSVNDIATLPSAAPITAGENSFEKYQFGVFSGTFTQISNGLWAHTAGEITDPEIELHGKVTSTYAQPSTDAMSGSTDMTSTIPITEGATVLFSENGPDDVSPTPTLEDEGYTQYLVTQIQTGSGAEAGPTTTIALTLRYNEN